MSEKKPKSTKTKKTAPVATDRREALLAFGRRLRRPRIAQVEAEMVTFVNESGASLKSVAEELGTLELAARNGLVDLVEALLAICVDPNVIPPRTPGSSSKGALASAFEAEDQDDPAFERMLQLLLSAGADPTAVCDSYNGRAEVVLDAAVYRRSRVGVRLLLDKVSETCKANAWCTFLARLPSNPRSPNELAWLGELLELMPVDGVGLDGMSPVHAAAACGDAELFDRIRYRAIVKVPQLPKAVSWELRLAAPPGGISNTVLLPTAATPLFVARAVRSKCEMYCALYRAAPEATPGRTGYIASFEHRIAELSKVIEALEQQGVIDGLQAPELPEPLSTVLSVSTAIAERIGVAAFTDKAATIDPTGKGPFGYFLSCVDLMRPALDERVRERLDVTLVGKFITGSLRCQVLVDDEEDPLEDFGRDPKDVRIRLDDYPESARTLLEQGKHYGLNGDNIVTLENSTGTTKLWEINTDEVIEHGDVVSWLTRSVGDITTS
ncbi:MAG: hypothetical protein H0T89_03610 [Deltaproteobacteria bacterium]|nr:hypothetical protein [Deltaproteobacteria bacterium]MDQ3296632.1 hypothetical protein [Myxococcota bacterium]